MVVCWVHYLLVFVGELEQLLDLYPVLTFSQLAYEARKARKIIASRDISYAFTNVMANNYYSLSMSHSDHRSSIS